MRQYFKNAVIAGTAAAVTLFSGVSAANDTIRVGMPEVMFLNLTQFVAQEKGFYENEGLTVDLQHIADSSIPVRAMIAGRLDIVQTGMPETLSAIDKGAELITIGGVHTGLHYSFFVNPDADIESIEDLQGKRLGISGPGTLPHVVMVAMMQAAGMTAEQIDDVTWVSLSGSSSRRNGIATGVIDATVAGFNPRAIADPNIDVKFDVPGTLPNYVMTPWDVRVSFLEENPDVVKRFIRAELLATRWVFENRDEALEVARNYFDYDDDELIAFYDFYKNGIWNPNGRVTPEQAQYMQELNLDGGMQDAVHPAERVLDTSILEEVLAEIGEYEH
ncbi:NitT/TauT family transport system substrate-binding protein [Natronocella acetinitrilica]|uniref:NitT/TauT family transport system substrate-binding protein n=1 Tax=Natronocella acetinitrilica TaxID=414046 RepID=A0AAE3KC29_9GAMM|nr:ABC transporter substrate-binding protein [Natronocella acetinitrilica]MCP1676400.1 NitT/TauT family transport system substrate-binding protein [Natronocella acetinitrilica]